MFIDASVYPDLDEPPRELVSLEDRADYVARICAAWDFYILPHDETFALFAGWKDVFDRFPLPASPAYHAFRSWYGWERVPMPPGIIGPEPRYAELDRLEGRPPDPCEGTV